MSGESKISHWVAFAFLIMFAAVVLFLAYGVEALPAWAQLLMTLIAFVAVAFGAIVAVPALREGAIGRRLELSLGSLGKIIFGSDHPLPSSIGDGPEKQLPPPSPETATAVKLVRKADQNLIGSVVGQGPDVAWGVAANQLDEGDRGMAIKIAEAALERYPTQHTKLLVLTGYLWRQEGKIDKAIALAERAIKCAEGKEADQEYYYVANSNLAFGLSLQARPSDKQRALQAAKLAAEQTGTYKNRDSFWINYGYAQMRFAEGLPELLEASVYLLTQLQQSTTVDAQETAEVVRYLQEAVQKMVASVQAEMLKQQARR